MTSQDASTRCGFEMQFQKSVNLVKGAKTETELKDSPMSSCRMCGCRKNIHVVKAVRFLGATIGYQVYSKRREAVCARFQFLSALKVVLDNLFVEIYRGS